MNNGHGQAGLSLVEVVVAVGVIMLALTPLLGLFVTSRFNVEDAGHRAQAISLARTSMDEIVSTSAWDQIRSDGPKPHPLDSTYTVTVTVTADRSPYLKEIQVKVEWMVPGQVHGLGLYSAVYRRE